VHDRTGGLELVDPVPGVGVAHAAVRDGEAAAEREGVALEPLGAQPDTVGDRARPRRQAGLRHQQRDRPRLQQPGSVVQPLATA